MWCGCAADSGVAAGLALWTCYSDGLLRGLAWLGLGYFFGLLFECLGCSLSLGLVAVWVAGSYLVLFLCGLGLAVQQIWWVGLLHLIRFYNLLIFFFLDFIMSSSKSFGVRFIGKNYSA